MDVLSQSQQRSNPVLCSVFCTPGAGVCSKQRELLIPQVSGKVTAPEPPAAPTPSPLDSLLPLLGWMV